jgi:hypothetical protein
MKNRYVVLWLVSVAAAVVTGAGGGWLLGWVTGNTVTAHVDRCYKYYGTTETFHTRCEGYWTPRRLDGEPVAVRGPLIGVPIDPGTKLVDPRTQHDLGYELATGHGAHLATLRGDAAIVIPRSHLVLGPAGLLGLVGCVVAFVVLSRRDAAADTRSAGADLPA